MGRLALKWDTKVPGVFSLTTFKQQLLGHLDWFTVLCRNKFSITLNNLFWVLLNFEIIKDQNSYFEQNNRELGPQTGTDRRSTIIWTIHVGSQFLCLIMRGEECAFTKPPLFVDSMPYVKNHGGYSNSSVPPHRWQSNFTDDHNSWSFLQQIWPLDFFQGPISITDTQI